LIPGAGVVLLTHGEVVVALEEGRLNRIKHTNKRPHQAVRFCLETAGIGPAQLDAVVFYATEPYVKRVLETLHLADLSQAELPTPRGMVQRLFRDELGHELDPAKIHFCDHHTGHAVSAYALSGYDEALVVTLDGQGEGISGVVYEGRRREMTPLHSFTEEHSVGYLYRDVIRFLGYEMFDEYKVMGMAPYGNPAPYPERYSTFFEWWTERDYPLHLDRVRSRFQILPPRRKGTPFTETHQHLAAALQEATEQIGLHVLTHFQRKTGHYNLCLAGGVAHNCSMNGRVLYESGFKRLFVQPAAHDAGCAWGAALAVQLQLAPNTVCKSLRHVFFGTDIGDDATIEGTLRLWQDFATIERCEDTGGTAADRLADGKAIGWGRGRSEFGPRALGNRSILADPRPADNKDIINRMVKKREAYRPFAPSVLAEHVDDYFVTTAEQKTFPTMSVILQVKPEKRDELGAVTHVDGTARVQTVDRDGNPRYWELIKAFGDRTGVPMLLNTSYNNHAEPIVDSVEDAVVAFLTTDLNALVVGDWLVLKKTPTRDEVWRNVVVTLPVTVKIDAVRLGGEAWDYNLSFNYHHGKRAKISTNAYRLLGEADGRRSLAELASAAGLTAEAVTAVLPEIQELWANRMLALRPGSV